MHTLRCAQHLFQCPSDELNRKSNLENIDLISRMNGTRPGCLLYYFNSQDVRRIKLAIVHDTKLGGGLSPTFNFHEGNLCISGVRVMLSF